MTCNGAVVQEETIEASPPEVHRHRTPRAIHMTCTGLVDTTVEDAVPALRVRLL
jgi:hypothetical protein